MSNPQTHNSVAATPATNYVTRRVLWFSIVAVASTYILYNADNMQETFLPFGFLHRSICPQQVVLAALTVYLLVDLAWYHPDFRNKASNKPKTTTATNSRNTSSSANELFSSLLKPPSFSIDVAEDVMTMLFMLFILTTADDSTATHEWNDHCNTCKNDSQSCLAHNDKFSIWRRKTIASSRSLDGNKLFEPNYCINPQYSRETKSRSPNCPPVNVERCTTEAKSNEKPQRSEEH